MCKEMFSSAQMGGISKLQLNKESCILCVADNNVHMLYNL